jgi:hypothetical protein
MPPDHENINWMIRLGKILNRLFVVILGILLCIGLLSGNVIGTLIILFWPILILLLWSHSLETSERLHTLEAEIHELKIMSNRDKFDDARVANNREPSANT